MIDRHAVQALLASGHSQKQVAQQLRISLRSVQRIAKEPAVESADDGEARRRRRVGRIAAAAPVAGQTAPVR